jgi:hypothetical protein
LVGLLRAWLDYAQQYQAEHGSNIGYDYVLGPEWATIGVAIRGLLNGTSGRLDCGTLDSILYDNLKEQGFDPDTL